MRVAKDLRKSENQHTRDNIYINRHLTKAEAAAAFNARSLRRQKEQAAAKNPEIHEQPNTTTPTSADNATIPPTPRNTTQPPTPEHLNVNVENPMTTP